MGEAHEILEIMVSPAGDERVFVRELEPAHEQAEKISGYSGIVHETDRCTAFPLLDSFGNFIEKADGDIVVQVEFGVAGEFDRVRLEPVVGEHGKIIA